MLGDIKCLDIPRPLGSALGLISILVMVCIQLSFLSIQLVQGLVYLLFMPMAPLALSWVVNHLYATPIGKVHVWVFQLYKRLIGLESHSQPVRVDIKTEINSFTSSDEVSQGEIAIHSIACLMDNYCYLLVDTSGAEPPYPCCIIDASEHLSILKSMNDLAVSQYGGRGEEGVQMTDKSANIVVNAKDSNTKKGQVVEAFSDVFQLEAILSTHRHWDHTHGNRGILNAVASCTRVYGGRMDDVPECTHPLDDNDVVSVGNMRIKAISTPCHTRGSLVYKVQGFEGVQDVLFTGDTLFTGGCGAPFEGNQHTMSRAFQRIWLESSPSTYFFPGHEYAEALLPGFFRDGGTQTLPNHPDDYKTLTNQFWITRRRRRFFRPPMPTIPVTVEVEMAYNPYFNSLHSAADVLAAILRRQCMKYSAEMQARANERVDSSLSERLKHQIPCPPNVDKDYWDGLPREMQQEMLISTKEQSLVGSPPLQYDGGSLDTQDSGFYGGASEGVAGEKGGTTEVDLIGGAPSASLDDTNEDYFARLSTSNSVVMQQFDFGGAYNYEVSLEQLIKALSVLSAGGDRVEVKTIYRALTTLGSHEGTGMCSTSAKRGQAGWRGMQDDEAKLLIDSFNFPQQVLSTTFDNMKTSTESLVVEYAATLFSQVCDRTVVPPPKGFLALCRRCKICPTSSRPKQGQQIRGESLSLERESTPSSSDGAVRPSHSKVMPASPSIEEETEEEGNDDNGDEAENKKETMEEDGISDLLDEEEHNSSDPLEAPSEVEMQEI